MGQYLFVSRRCILINAFGRSRVMANSLRKCRFRVPDYTHGISLVNVAEVSVGYVGSEAQDTELSHWRCFRQGGNVSDISGAV